MPDSTTSCLERKKVAVPIMDVLLRRLMVLLSSKRKALQYDIIKKQILTLGHGRLKSCFDHLESEGGELMLGTRRATRPKNILPDTTMGNLNSYSEILASVANAVSTNISFHVFYSPMFSGVVTGVGDLDSYILRSSKWRCL